MEETLGKIMGKWATHGKNTWEITMSNGNFSTISMAMCNSEMLVYQRVNNLPGAEWYPLSHPVPEVSHPNIVKAFDSRLHDWGCGARSL